MVKLTIVAALVLAITQCFCGTSSVSGFSGRPRLDGRIVGGYQIDITDAPHTVSVGLYGNHICGGSIINEKWILTSAHCTYAKTASMLKTTVGTSTPGASGTNKIDVTRIVAHPDFSNFNLDNDFSLLELATNLTFDSTMQPIGLPEQDQEYPDDTPALVTGWGDTKNANESRDRLRAVSVPLVNQELCNDAYREFRGITDSMICAGYLFDGGKDACQGDSGGPMVIDGKLVGLVSWGKGCAEAGYPGVYARVASVSSWIKNVTGI